MPKYFPLLSVLTLAACEPADQTTTPQPKFDPPPAPAEQVTIEKPAVAPAATEPAALEPSFDPPPAAKHQPKKLTIDKHVVPSDKEIDRRCMSRAGCRWEREHLKPRVTKKPQPTTDNASENP